jgi:hypothetical protein
MKWVMVGYICYHEERTILKNELKLCGSSIVQPQDTPCLGCEAMPV